MKTPSATARRCSAKLYGKFEFRAKVPLGQGPVAGAVAAAAGRQVRRLGGVGRDRRDGDRRREAARGAGQRPLRFGYPSARLVTHVHELPGGSTVADCHVYTVEWEPGEIRWSVDGELWATQTFWWSCSKPRKGAGIEARRSRRT